MLFLICPPAKDDLVVKYKEKEDSCLRKHGPKTFPIIFHKQGKIFKLGAKLWSYEDKNAVNTVKSSI